MTKFGYDKRLPHLSSMIASGQISRSQGLERLKSETYPAALRHDDFVFVLKKFGLSEQEYQGLLETAPRSHLDYPNLSQFYLRSSRFLNAFRRAAKAA